jgi:hypothetical protein
MSVLFQYFSASDDEEAAAAINMPGGPGRPVPAESARSGWKRRRAVPATAPVFDIALTGGFDPVVQMGTLEAELTGRDYDEITAGPRPGYTVARTDDGQRLVIALTDELTEALAGADVQQLRSAAEPWSRTDEFFGHGDPDILADALSEMAGLARASAGNRRLYCWVCI